MRKLEFNEKVTSIYELEMNDLTDLNFVEFDSMMEKIRALIDERECFVDFSPAESAFRFNASSGKIDFYIIEKISEEELERKRKSEESWKFIQENSDRAVFEELKQKYGW